MRAFSRSVRISPKKANLVAGIVRGMYVSDALHLLGRTPKRAARILEDLIKSAAANAEHNDRQNIERLVIQSLIVNQAGAHHRGVPMARGRVRPIRKFMSHIEVTLMVAPQEKSETGKEKASLKPKNSSKSQRLSSSS